MNEAGHGRWLQRGALLLSVVAGLLLLATATAVPVAAQGSGFDVLFTVDVDASTVNVQLTVPLKGEPEIVLEIHAAAVAVVALVDGSEAPVALRDGDDFSMLAIVETSGGRELVLHYTVPSDPPRSKGTTRVNPAHISFFAWVDLNLGNGSVRVELPPNFRGDNYGGQLSIDNQALGNQSWVAGSIGATDLFAEVVARNESGLRRSSVSLGPVDVAIAGWADDTEWIAFAEQAVEQGVPLLEDLIGQPWPQSDLVVIESTEPYTEGLAGWFDIWGSEINVGDGLDEATMLHELAHAWFNYVRLEDRWMVEGWAEDYSSLALSMKSGTQVAPPVPDPDAVGSTDLANWTTTRDDDFASVRNSYDTSWYVLHTIREEIGDDAMADVLAAMLEGRRSYHVAGEAAVYPANTTARFLDLVQEVGGSAKAADLFGTYVLSGAWDSRLAARSAALDAYTNLKALGDFLPPKLIRDRLEEWKFGEAQLLISEADAVAQRLVSLQLRAVELGAEVPESLVRSYESATISFADVEGRLLSAEQSMTRIEALDGDALDTALLRFSLGNYAPPRAGSADGAATSLPWLPIGVTALVLVVGVFVAAQFRAAKKFF